MQTVDTVLRFTRKSRTTRFGKFKLIIIKCKKKNYVKKKGNINTRTFMAEN